MSDDVDEGSAAMRGSDAYQRPDVVWACQWGRWFSIYDTAAEAQEYGLNRGDDEPFWVFPFRAMRWIPVDEQMPEKGVPVLVAWTDGGSASVAASISLAWIVGDVWRSVEGGHRLDGVTHWMATPDHPHDCE